MCLKCTMELQTPRDPLPSEFTAMNRAHAQGMLEFCAEWFRSNEVDPDENTDVFQVLIMKRRRLETLLRLGQIQEQELRWLAFVMASHARLGVESLLGKSLSSDVLRLCVE